VPHARSQLNDHLPFIGIFRRSSSKKFSRKITWFCACCASGVSIRISATTRFPSEARSKFRMIRPSFGIIPSRGGRPMLLRTCLTLFVVAGVWAQQTQPAKPPQKRNDPLTRSSFSAKGLHHEDDLTDFFVGNFADLPFDRGTIGFSVLFQQYMEAYGRHCDAYLPANKVEMTTRVCADAPTPPNPYDPPFGPKDCSTWRTISLGYADPALYAAKAQLDEGQVANVVKDVLGSKNLIGSAVDALQLTGDLDALVRLNACDGAGLRRFQENVVLFSKGKQPLLLPGAPPPVAPSAQPLGVLADSDYNRLVEDLVADQARTWAFNRYVSGSTSHVIVSHDPTGRPAKILAKYLFSSPGSGRTQGSVTVGFSDGMPECIYFFDAPARVGRRAAGS
jgi:hypothetical protein